LSLTRAGQPSRSLGAAGTVAPRRLPRGLVVALVLLLALALLYPELLFQGRIFLSADARNADAFALVGDAALAKGHYPMWNPYLFAGMPTFGSLSYTRFLYPPGMVFRFFQDTLHLPPMTWMLAHLLFGGLGMAYLLSRWRLPTAALVLGALAWMLFPRVTAWAVHGHGSKLAAAMYLPWIVAFTLEVLGGRGRRSIGLLAMLLGLQVLRGHTQITYYTLLTVGGLVLANGLVPLAPGAADAPIAVRWRRGGLVMVGLVLAFLLGAVLLIPLHDYAGISIRGQTSEGGGLGYDYATAWSLSPRELGTLIWPSAAGFGKATYQGQMPFTDYPNYFGWLLLALAVAAWWTGRRALVGVLGLLAGLALLIAFGRHAPFLYDLLYNHLPYFNKFRVPSMILILGAFAVAVLAGHGASALAGEPEHSARWRRPLPLVVMGLGLLVLLLGGSGLLERAYQQHLRDLAQAAGKTAAPVLLQAAWILQRADLVRIGLVLLAAGGALLLAARKTGFRRSGLIWVLAALLLLDMRGVDIRITHPERSLKDVVAGPDGRGQLVNATALLQRYRPAAAELGQGPLFASLAAAAGHERVFPLGSLATQNELMVAEIRSLGGYHPAKLAFYEKVRARLYGRPPAGRLASWLAGAVVTFDQALPAELFPALRNLGLDLAEEPLVRGSTVAYRNRAALRRARLVTAYALAAEGEAASNKLDAYLARIQEGSEPVAERVLLDRLPSPAPTAAAEPLPAPEYLVDGLDEIILRTAADRSAILLLADMWAPGWRVAVDGRETDLLQADHILRGVALGPGPHEVRFHYRDPALMRGLRLTLLGLIGVLVLLLWPARRDRNGADHPAGDAA
jgi:hypothetical protein